MVGTRHSHRVSRLCHTILFTVGTLLLQYERATTDAHPPQSQAAPTSDAIHGAVEVPGDAQVATRAQTVTRTSDSLLEKKSWSSTERQLPTAASQVASVTSKSARLRQSGDSLAEEKGNGERREKKDEKEEGSSLRDPSGDEVKHEVTEQKDVTSEAKSTASHSVGSKGAPSKEVNCSQAKHLNGKGVEVQGRPGKKKKKDSGDAPPFDPQAPIEELLDPAKIHRRGLTKRAFSELTVNQLPQDYSAMSRLKRKTDGEVYQEAQEVYEQAKAVQQNYDKSADIAEAKASPPKKLSWYTRFMEAVDRFFARWGKK